MPRLLLMQSLNLTLTDTINDYRRLTNDKPDRKTWNISDYKVAMQALKTCVDSPIYAKKDNLVEIYEVVH